MATASSKTAPSPPRHASPSEADGHRERSNSSESAHAQKEEGAEETKEVGAEDTAGGQPHQPQQKEKGGKNDSFHLGVSKKSKLFPTAILSNAERDELHNEIFTYFKWLEQSIILTQSLDRASAVGTSVTAIQHVLKVLEMELHSVRDGAAVLNKTAEDLVNLDRVALLETCCQEQLKIIVETTTQDSQVERNVKTWDDRYDELVKNMHILHTHTIQEMDEKYDGMGDWLRKQRALYAIKDENFMKERAKRLDAIPNFPWVQPTIERVKPVMKKTMPSKSTDRDKWSPPEEPAQHPPVLLPIPPTHPLPPVLVPIPPTHPLPPMVDPFLYNQYFMAGARAYNETLAANNASYAVNPPRETIEFLMARKNRSAAANVSEKNSLEYTKISTMTAMNVKKNLPPSANNASKVSARKKRKSATTTNEPTAKKTKAPPKVEKAKPTKPKQPPPRQVYGKGKFEEGFNLLVEYKEKHGHCNCTDWDTRLGRWIHAMRKRRIEMANENNADQAEEVVKAAHLVVKAAPGKLGLSVQFVKDNNDDVGQAEITSVHETCSFKDNVKQGDRILMIDGDSVTNLESLSHRADQTRTIIIAIKSEEKSDEKPRKKRPFAIITEEQIQKLDNIGFIWEQNERYPSWEQSFQHLMTYYNAHGDFRVPRSYHTPEDNYHLGNWVHRQRTLYRKKIPKFMKERAPKLDAVGFEWKPKTTNFENNFRDLVAYKQKFGHVNVPNNNNLDNELRTLGRWCATLRDSKMLNEKRRESGVKEATQGDYLTAERIERLDSLGFDWVKRSRVKNGRSKKRLSSPVDVESEEQPDGEMEEHHYDEVQPAYGEWA